MMFLSAAIALLFVAAGWFVYQLVIQQGRLQIRLDSMEQQLREQGLLKQSNPILDGLPRGSSIPDFELPLVGGGSMKLSAWHDREILLIFFNPGCTHSLRLIPALYSIEATRIDKEPIPLIVSTGDAEENRRLFEGHTIASRVMVQKGSEVSTQCRVIGTPMGYLIDRENKTAGNLMIGADVLSFSLSSYRDNH